ncbi:MAG: N-acetyl-gamma-glutamyl-phosphate reductase [Gammaproteobacteria bacterium]|nr:N-acetyl-gamma-glutamyl-phosphate reductase [Gammaproteobacteria bacterium]
MSEQVKTIVIGSSGYVGGELLRLIAGHPQLELAAAVSASNAGQAINSVFPHLQNAFGNQSFIEPKDLAQHLQGKVAVFSAAPHGASAGMIAEVIAQAKEAEINVVDVSADFRFADANAYAEVYAAHGAPELLDQFVCALPEHIPNTEHPHVGHPGCFATAMLLAAVPLLQLDLIEPEMTAFGITGSTGSGQSPTAGTHHPVRHSNLYAYNPLGHRHAPEVVAICKALTGKDSKLSFLPHSGPFARGIHMTVQAKLKNPLSTEELFDTFSDFYSHNEFVTLVKGTPKLKDVTCSNYAQIGVVSDGDTVVVFSVIDNLIKGAAGGAVQWMNRKLGFDESLGLNTPATGWG